MALVVACVVPLTMWFLDKWTSHGEERVVPDVHTLTLSKAKSILSENDLQVEVIDSVYESDIVPGTVVEQVPPAGNRVKPGRIIFLTINATSPRQVTIPDVVNMSLRQAKATLTALGCKNISEVRVRSDYKDLVLGVKSVNGELKAGASVSVTAPIVLEVGAGYDPDSIVPSLEEIQAVPVEMSEEEVSTETSAEDSDD